MCSHYDPDDNFIVSSIINNCITNTTIKYDIVNIDLMVSTIYIKKFIGLERLIVTLLPVCSVLSINFLCGYLKYAHINYNLTTDNKQNNK